MLFHMRCGLAPSLPLSLSLITVHIYSIYFCSSGMDKDGMENKQKVGSNKVYDLIQQIPELCEHCCCFCFLHTLTTQSNSGHLWSKLSRHCFPNVLLYMSTFIQLPHLPQLHGSLCYKFSFVLFVVGTRKGHCVSPSVNNVKLCCDNKLGKKKSLVTNNEPAILCSEVAATFPDVPYW